MDSNAKIPDLRIVLVGKTGAGKSSSGNTILGRHAFPVSPTAQCQEETGKSKHPSLSVVDTPGLRFKERLPEEQVKREISRCVSFAPPHVFLVVIQAGRFTEEQQETVKIIQQMFGKEAAGYMMVLFTRGDDVEADGTSIEKIIIDNDALSEFISQCHGGYHVFNNRSRDPSQVRELLEKINIMVQRNGGRYYSKEMSGEVLRAVDKKTKRACTEMEQEEETSPALGESPAADFGGPVGAEGVPNIKYAIEVRMVLVGKSGVGKSASGNTILGKQDTFKSIPSPNRVTSECQKVTRVFEHKLLAVVDTPGLFDTKGQDKVKTEISRCISLAAPGPHVFLVVLQGGRFSKEEQEIMKIIQQIFGKEALCYTMVLFTRGDDVEADGDSIENIMSEDKALHDFISQCHGGYHVFNNRSRDPSQVRELLEKINTMVQRNGGSCYSKELFEKAEREERRRLQKEKPHQFINKVKECFNGKSQTPTETKDEECILQ